MADNYLIDIVCDRKETFDLAFALVASMHYSLSTIGIIGWTEKKGALLLFTNMLDSDKPKVTLFPSRLSIQAAAEIAWNWLSTREYPQEPDQDGSNKKGYRIFTNSEPDDIWYQPMGMFGALLAVKPEWCMYGK